MKVVFLKKTQTFKIQLFFNKIQQVLNTPFTFSLSFFSIRHMYRHFKGAVNYNLPNLYNVYKTLSLEKHIMGNIQT